VWHHDPVTFGDLNRRLLNRSRDLKIKKESEKFFLIRANTVNKTDLFEGHLRVPVFEEMDLVTI
jgi:hypothetical protein